jgi:beta-glucanase (GH16 family)
MKHIFILIASIVLTMTSCVTSQVKSAQWELVWSDEFEVPGIPTITKWIPIDKGAGWSNDEKQAYTRNRNNYFVENGCLVIEARKEKYRNAEYTSARLMTQNMGDWTYGRFEVKAKLPTGRGVWPAIWMLPTNTRSHGYGWPDSGEIDIMENVGFEPDIIHATVHSKAYNWTKKNQRSGQANISGIATDFHVYFLEWGPDRIDIGVDDRVILTDTNEKTGWEAWPFDRPFYLILNIAVGGNWGGMQGIDDSIFPQRMEVDYVRVYRDRNIETQ